MTSLHGRIDTRGQWFDYVLGGQKVPARFGHAVSGNQAVLLRFTEGEHSFTSLSRGQIISVSPEDTNGLDCASGRTVKLYYSTSISENNPEGVVFVDLSHPGAGVHIPGGREVRIVTGGVDLVTEHVGTRGNVPEIFDRNERSDLIAQGSGLISYLLPGDSISSSVLDVVNKDSNYSLVNVRNEYLAVDDRVFLVIRGDGDDVCYVQGANMKIDVLSGSGSVLLQNLDSVAETKIQELMPGSSLEIPSGTRVKYSNSGKLGDLILRDTTRGFHPSHEVDTEKYLASRGVIAGPTFGSR